MAAKPLSTRIKKASSKLGKVFTRKKPRRIQRSEAEHTSLIKPISSAAATSTFAKAPPSPANDSELTTVKYKRSIVCLTNPVKLSLWDRAYDSLRYMDEKLVRAYEQLLSRELQTITSPNNAIVDNNDELEFYAENRIENDDHRIRLTQLETISRNGLLQLENKRVQYNIFGHNFVLRDQLAQASQFVQNIKGTIDVAVRASPEASLALAGICAILPTFMIPSAAEEANYDGYLYVTSRINFYIKLESLLLGSDNLQASGIYVDIEQRLLTLYQLIIEFQIKLVRHVYLTRLVRLKEGTVQRENWKGMIIKIQESEKTLSDDFKLANDAAMRAALEELNGNVVKLFTKIDSMLASLTKTSSDVPAYYFQHAHG